MWNFLFGIKEQPLIAPSVNSLRLATASQHRQMQQTLQLPVSIQTLTNYRRWLARLLGIYQPLEQLLAGFPGWLELGVRIHDISQTSALRQDLTALGGTPRDMRQIELSCPLSLPLLETLPAAFGALYVLEASKLTGNSMLKLLHQRLGRDCHGARAFYTGHGRESDARWVSFKRTFNRFSASQPADFPEVLAGAKATFAAVQLWMLPLTGNPALATLSPSTVPQLHRMPDEVGALSVQV